MRILIKVTCGIKCSTSWILVTLDMLIPKQFFFLQLWTLLNTTDKFWVFQNLRCLYDGKIFKQVLELFVIAQKKRLDAFNATQKNLTSFHRNVSKKFGRTIFLNLKHSFYYKTEVYFSDIFFFSLHHLKCQIAFDKRVSNILV